MATNLLCRLGRHKWKLTKNEKSGRDCLQCQRCGKDRNVPGDWAAEIKARKAASDIERGGWGGVGGDFGGMG